MPNTNTAVCTATPDTTSEVTGTSRFLIDGNVVAQRCAELGAHNDRDRARVMGIGRNTLHRWRNGSDSVPRLDTIDSVCRRLGVARDVLFPGL
jgi:DNA-binding Xre family transcriptional regulator